MGKNDWKYEDIEYLRKNYCRYSAREISKIINKTQRSIWNMAVTLGLDKQKYGSLHSVKSYLANLKEKIVLVNQ